MFVKIENYYDRKDSTLIINVEKISSIRSADIDYAVRPNSLHKEFKFFQNDNYKHKYIVTMDTVDDFILNETQYEELCRALNRVSK